MILLTIATAIQFVILIGLAVVVLSLARQVGILHERLSPAGMTRARERLILLSGDGTDKRAVWRADLGQLSPDAPGVERYRADAAPIPTARRRERVDSGTVLAAAAAHRRMVEGLQRARFLGSVL